MSLGAALQIGRSGLIANQIAIEVTGNNLANVATKGYHRQVVTLAPANNQELARGVFVGRGVQVLSIRRQVNEALEARLRDAVSNQAGSTARSNILAQIEALHNELSDNDLSSRLSAFFSAWSQLANNPQDVALRSLVLQEGSRVASFVQEVRFGLTELRTQTDRQIDASVVAADDLLTRIADLNLKIAAAEQGAPGAAGLRDQRDQLLAELAQYMDISTVEQPTGVVDVFVGSIPIILNGLSRGVEVRKTTVGNDLQIDVVLKDDGSLLSASAGQIGALIASRRNDINAAITRLDSFTNTLIYEVNKLHSRGQGLEGFSSVTGTGKVTDAAAALNVPGAGLAFTPTHGSFQIHVTDPATGQRVSTTINVDLDGIGADTTLTSLVADLNAVANVSATILPDGRLRIESGATNLRVSFSDDTSGALAALGINTFFTGRDALDMSVNPTVAGNLNLIAATSDHHAGGNANALALAGLRDAGLPALGGLSLLQSWSRHVEDYAIRLGQTQARMEADEAVYQSLLAQQQSVSGVNTDEEAINLLAFQRAYQGSAKFLTVVDEMLETLMSLA